MKKLDYEFVKKYFENQNYKLISEEYHGVREKLKYICNNGHEGEILFSTFQRGIRCAKCYGNSKIDNQIVSEFFKEKGCILLGKIENSQTPVEYQCNCGNISKIRWNDFRIGKRCKVCKSIRISGERHPKWNPNKKLHNKVTRAAHTALDNTLRQIGIKKNNKTKALLGYGVLDLLNRLQNHPNWELVKDLDWSIDHIFPIKAFIDYEIFDIRLINALENLQPMLLKDNLKKNASYIKEDFENWLRSNGHAIKN